MMSSVLQLFYGILRSAHGTAFLIGATSYLAYSFFFSVRVSSQSQRAKGAGRLQKQDQQKKEPNTFAVIATAGAAIVAIAAVSLWVPNLNDKCQELQERHTHEATLGALVGEANSRAQNESSDEIATRPSTLLGQAREALDLYHDNSIARSALHQCIQWAPEASSDQLADADEMQAQLQCYSALIEPSMQSSVAVDLLSQSRHVYERLREQSNSDGEIWNSTQVEWAKITHAALQNQCGNIGAEMRSLRKDVKNKQLNLKAAISALQTLAALRKPFVEVLQATRQSAQVLRPLAAEGSFSVVEELEELRDTRVASRICMLQCLHEARGLARVLPESSEHVQKAVDCDPEMMVQIEALILQQAEQEPDAAAATTLGEYWSEIGISGQAATFFGSSHREPSWVQDSAGLYAPEHLVKGELLMKNGEEGSLSSERFDRGASRALRLYQHAKFLALKHHDAAAEWRYRASADVAAANHREKLAAHALTRLGYFLILRGRQNEAVDIIKEALDYFEDPLGLYLQATLRRSLGKLQTAHEIQEVEDQVAAVQGQLPSKALEDQRTATHIELQFWREAANGSLLTCLSAQDAAKFFICVFCGLFLKSPPAENN